MIVVAYQPLGSLNTVIALAIAGVKVLIIAAIFMDLRERGSRYCFRRRRAVLARDIVLARVR
jgi:hypothetical protein